MGRARSILVALVFATVIAACAGNEPIDSGSPTGGSPSGRPAAFPVTVRGTNGPVTIEQQPGRIVSLSPTATEDLFAIDAGRQIVAVDDQSNYPPEAPMTDLSGFDPNVEAIAGYDPDLVVFATEPGDLGSSLESLGITALQLDAAVDLEDAFGQIEQLGAATGHAVEAEALAEQLRSEVDALVAGADPSAGLSFYYELDDTFYSVTSKTFIGQLFKLLGLANIADAAGRGSGGYPQLSAEYIIKADPDLIFLADTRCCGQSPKTVADRPGWGDLQAVTGDGIVSLDDDVASRWGPRVVELLRQIGDSANVAAVAA